MAYSQSVRMVRERDQGRKSTKKHKLNHTLDQIDPTDIYRTNNPTAGQYTLFFYQYMEHSPE